MLFSDSFLTIKTKSEALYKDRGSKFYAFCYPVKNEEEIKETLRQLKQEHPSATHHCFAWRLGADKQAFRMNDDGEPSGTAGKPIFGQIQALNLSNVLIVVVRYFGGTQLGVPGLIHAYKAAAAAALAETVIEEQFVWYEYSIEFDVEDMSSVMRLLKELQCKIIQNSYQERNLLLFQIKKQYSQQLEDRVKELYRTNMEFKKFVQ